MARNPPQIEIYEIGGDRFPDLCAAQRSARYAIARAMAETIKRMIQQGRLEVKNNQIIPKGK